MPICKFDGCTKKANSNFKNEKERIFCAKHKEKNMIDLDEKTKYCIVIECTTRASYNYVNENKAIYCTQHKKENMINVNAKKCIEKNCNNLPSCNFKNENIVLNIKKKE